MIFVQSLVEGLLANVGSRFIIRSLEEGRWKTDRGPVDVDPGVCVSFLSSEDRDHFLAYQRKVMPRAQIPEVKEGDVLLFCFEQDVALLEAQGVIRRLTQQEIEIVVTQAQSGEEIAIEVPQEPASDVSPEEESTVVNLKPKSKPKGKRNG